MARRPVFVPILAGPQLVATKMIEFVWHPGMSVLQKQKSISSLHAAARKALVASPILEISTKSSDALGRRLSAFNLTLSHPGFARPVSVECAFQAGKVFEEGGPFLDLLHRTSAEAKRDPRLQGSGALASFRFKDDVWPLQPQTAFYDWLYLSAVEQAGVVHELAGFSAFTDIEFNPEKSINCQAQAAALGVALHHRGLLATAMTSRDAFIEHARDKITKSPPLALQRQGSLF